MKYLYKCPTCKRGHGGQAPSIEKTIIKPCDKHKKHEATRTDGKLLYATMVSGASIKSNGEYL